MEPRPLFTRLKEPFLPDFCVCTMLQLICCALLLQYAVYLDHSVHRDLFKRFLRAKMVFYRCRSRQN